MNRFFTKEEVKYTDTHGDSPEYCRKCGHTGVMATQCRILVNGGPINPDGWCQKFFYRTEIRFKPFMFRESLDDKTAA